MSHKIKVEVDYNNLVTVLNGLQSAIQKLNNWIDLMKNQLDEAARNERSEVCPKKD